MIDTSLKQIHLDWLEFNDLPLYVYINFLEDISPEFTPFLERSIKLDIQTGNVVNQKRYSINIKNSTEQIALKTLNRFLNYSLVEPKELENNIKLWLAPNLSHDWYVGIDNNIHKIGADYHGKGIVGIAANNRKLYTRRYDIYGQEDWATTLTDYVSLYSDKFNKQIKNALDLTIKQTLELEDSYIYIKQDIDNIVWHFNCKSFQYPQFNCLLCSNFNEHFTWFSIDSNLKHLTLYMRPNFS